MLQLLSPAGSTEAVIAAVQNGADMIHIGFGASETGRNEKGFSSGELAQCLRYCRVRGCRTAVAIGELVTDDGIEQAVERAVFAARSGADAIMVQDIGLIDRLRRVLPETPLWGGVRLGIHDLDGALAAAALGLSRIMLMPELTLAEIRHIAQNAPIETGVCVHGPMCFARIGQCYMSAFSDARRSDSALLCAEPCRGAFSLGGRMDDCPMSMPDAYLIEHLSELEEAGVACAVIGGRSRRPEYVAYVTNLYSHAIRDGVMPTEEDRERLLELFAPYGLTDGCLTGEKGSVLLGREHPAGRAAERAFAEIRKTYMDGEYRRVPVTFYAVLTRGRTAMFAAEDDRGHRAVYDGFAPVDLGRRGITEARIQDVMFRTGGTPYSCVGVKCAIEPDLDYPDEAIEQARRALLSQITDQNRDPAPVTVVDIPEDPVSPDGSVPPEDPAAEAGQQRPQFIIEVSRADQLTAELAEAEPDRLYVPAELLAAGPDGLDAFRAKGAVIAAVLPRVVTDEEMPVLRELLATMKAMGVTEVLVGNLGHIPAAMEAGMTVRGDFGLNLTNSRAVRRMRDIGLPSVTASFQLSARQIRRLASAASTEMIVYGRMPVMITEQCLILSSSGRCSCSTPTSMSDVFGSVYPVEKAFGCRNVVYDRRKIFLADRPDVYENAGLWGVRLLFTTESARECVDVAMRYRGKNRYLPTNVGRGLYGKGVL